ncbi:hypothetical protein B0J14DRAFT_703307 [Halenospora varia]|nr:hypothetical protein B0J14DRAFT_703307 [Halenospora varia]
MDPLSITASACGILSLAGQLCRGFVELCDVLKAIKDAPAEIAGWNRDAEICLALLHEFEANDNTPQFPSVAVDLLERCAQHCEELKCIANCLSEELYSDSKIKRKLAVASAITKQEKVSRIQSKLQAAKMDLLLVYRKNNAQFEIFEQRLTAMMPILLQIPKSLPYEDQSVLSDNNFENLLEWTTLTVAQEAQHVPVSSRETGSAHEKPPSDSNCTDPTASTNSFDPTAINRRRPNRRLYSIKFKSIPFIGGRLDYSKNTYQIAQDDGLSQASTSKRMDKVANIKFMPYKWMTYLGVSYMFQLNLTKSAAAQMQQARLRVFKIVPDDAPFFRYCKNGDYKAAAFPMLCTIEQHRDYKVKETILTSMWLVQDILPAFKAEKRDRSWWTQALYVAINTPNPSLAIIAEWCERDAVDCILLQVKLIAFDNTRRSPLQYAAQRLAQTFENYY